MNLFKTFKTFDEIMPLFLADIKIQIKHKSFLSYSGTTKVFSEWLTLHGLSSLPLRKISSDTMAEFFTYLATGRKLDRPTCQKYAISLKKLFKFAEKRGEVEIFPFDLITFPQKGISRGAQVISPTDSKILLDDMEKNNPQLYLAYLTQYYLCLRPGRELRLLKLNEMDFKTGTVTVLPENAKTGKKRVVTMPLQYIELCHRAQLESYDKNLYVFGNNKQGVPGNEPWSVNMLRYKFNQFRDKYKFPKSYQFYSGKHSGITRLHNSGAPIIDSMEQAGHSSILSHQHYLHQHTETINQTIRNNYPAPY